MKAAEPVDIHRPSLFQGPVLAPLLRVNGQRAPVLAPLFVREWAHSKFPLRAIRLCGLVVKGAYGWLRTRVHWKCPRSHNLSLLSP